MSPLKYILFTWFKVNKYRISLFILEISTEPWGLPIFFFLPILQNILIFQGSPRETTRNLSGDFFFSIVGFGTTMESDN